MRRTPFKRPTPKPRPERERPALQLVPRHPDAPRGVMVRADAAAAPVPKREYVRSEALMRAYRLIPCQHCGADDGTVCGAHPNTGAAGKGMAIKADDHLAAALCHRCHAMIDQGSALTYEQRVSLQLAAHLKTVALLVLRGLWPPGVPLPAPCGAGIPRT
jgi:hypothetical protein